VSRGRRKRSGVVWFGSAGMTREGFMGAWDNATRTERGQMGTKRDEPKV